MHTFDHGLFTSLRCGRNKKSIVLIVYWLSGSLEFGTDQNGIIIGGK